MLEILFLIWSLYLGVGILCGSCRILSAWLSDCDPDWSDVLGTVLLWPSYAILIVLVLPVAFIIDIVRGKR